MVTLLVWAGADSPAAIAATVIIRLATLWFAVVIGVCTLFLEVSASSARRRDNER
jgi:uncharacterized membrane protein YbhN (UPF0104 family)